MGRKSYLIHFIDEFGKAVTTLTSVTVNITGGGEATIYTTPARTTEKTNPIETGLSDGTVEFYYNGASCELVVSDGTFTRIITGITPATPTHEWPSHMSSHAFLDVVKDFGGDIQATIDAMVDGDHFYLPPGNFKITSTIEIGALEYCKFDFDGVIEAVGCSGLTFDDIRHSTINVNAVLRDSWDWGVGNYWGVKFKKTYYSNATFNKISQFTYGIYFDGDATYGVAYNRFNFGSIKTKYGLYFESHNDGWVNANSYHGGKIWVDSDTKAAKSGGWGIYFKASPSHQFYNHAFYDVVLEGLHNGIQFNSNNFVLLSMPHIEDVDDNWINSGTSCCNLRWIIGASDNDQVLDLTKISVDANFKHFSFLGNHPDANSSIIIDGSDYGGIVAADPADSLAVLGRCSIDKTGKCWQFENADGYVQKLSAVRQEYGTAAPTTETWQRGSIVWNTEPSAGGAPGWVCVVAGEPGTWKAMANVGA